MFISLINNSHLQGGSRTANYSWNYVCVYQIPYGLYKVIVHRDETSNEDEAVLRNKTFF